MGHHELDSNISDEARAIRESVQHLAREIFRPAGITLDRLSDPAAAIAKRSPYWDVVRKYREMDLHRARLPKDLGGLGGELDPGAVPLIVEELAWGDAGLTMSLGASTYPFHIASFSDDNRLRQIVRDYCHDLNGDMVGCWAVSEPDRGSDWLMATDPGEKPFKFIPQVKAVRKGDDYIISGQKSAWVTNGTIATHACLLVCLDQDKEIEGLGMAIVPLDLPGISKGKPTDKIGLRAQNQGEIFFEEVVIPRNFMVVEEGKKVLHLLKVMQNQLLVAVGMSGVGLAQSAYDEALKYSRERVQGGNLICEHKNIKQQLFHMFLRLESSRAFCREVFVYNARMPHNQSHAHALAAKIYGSECAFQVAQSAVSVFGAAGLSREYMVEKLLRDARMCIMSDGDNGLLAIRGASEIQ